MNNVRQFLVAAIAAVSLAMPAIGGEDAGKESGEPSVTLRYKFQPGETVRWNVVHRARVKTQVAGNAQTAETVSKSVKAWRVGEVRPDGTATFQHIVENVDMWQKLTGRDEIRYNSESGEEPPDVFKNVAASVGTPIMTVTMDATGEVLSRSGKSKAQTVENEGNITIPLPKEPIAVGQSWSFPHDIEVPNGSTGTITKIKSVQKYTFSELKNGIATIEVATQILTPVHDPAIEAQLIQHQSSGAVRFDVEAGRIESQQMDLDKQVVGFRGEVSSLHYLTRFTEKLLPAAARTASRPLNP